MGQKPFSGDPYEVKIQLAADPRKGVWAANTLIKQGRTIRTAGQAPTSASAHTLLVIALTSALQDIGWSQAQTLARANHVVKPRVQVLTADATFASAMQRIPATIAALRAGKNFVGELRRQLDRFTIRVQHVEAREVELLKGWAQRKVMDRREIGRIPVIFAPTAVSQLMP